MVDFLLRIEQACLELHWPVLLVPGILAAFLGLFLWLGGLRYASAVLGVVGAIIGAFLGTLLSQWIPLHPVLTICIAAAVMCLLAVMVQQAVIFVLASVIFATICGGFYLSYSMTSESWQGMMAELQQEALTHPQAANDSEGAGDARHRLLRQLARAHLSEQQGNGGDDGEAHETGLAKLRAILAELQFSAESNKTTLIVWIVIGSLAGLFVAFVLKKIIMAFCCSLVGATAVCLGTFAILFAKKAEVFSGLLARPRLMPLLFVGMVALGLLMQLLFARKPKKATETSEEKE